MEVLFFSILVYGMALPAVLVGGFMLLVMVSQIIYNWVCDILERRNKKAP